MKATNIPNSPKPKFQPVDRPRPITLNEACQLYGVSKRVAMRWKKNKKLRVLGRWTLKSGQKGLVVDENQFLMLAGGRKTQQLSLRFYVNALDVGCIPKLALDALSSGALFNIGKHPFFDVDLTHAAMHLAMDHESYFFEYLCTPRLKNHKLYYPAPNDSEQSKQRITFTAEVARLCGANEQLHCRRHPWQDQLPVLYSFDEFKRAFYQFMRQIGNGAAARNLTEGTKPQYLDRVSCTSIPAWAKRPVWPIRQLSRTKQIMLTIEAAAAKNPELAEYLQVARKSLRDMPPAYNRAVRHEQGDPMLAEEIEILANSLAHFGIKKHLARLYCHAYSRLVHHNIYRHNKQKYEARNFHTPYCPEKIPQSVINRIFGAKSKLWHQDR